MNHIRKILATVTIAACTLAGGTAHAFVYGCVVKTSFFLVAKCNTPAGRHINGDTIQVEMRNAGAPLTISKAKIVNNTTGTVVVTFTLRSVGKRRWSSLIFPGRHYGELIVDPGILPVEASMKWGNEFF